MTDTIKSTNNIEAIEEFKTKLQNMEFKSISEFYNALNELDITNLPIYDKFIKEVSKIIEDTGQKNMLKSVVNTQNTQQDVFIGVTNITEKTELPPLPKGEIDITALPNGCHMLEFDPIITKHICKLGNAKYWNQRSPVTLVADGIKKYKALEARSISFDSIPEIIDFLKANKNKLVYTINYFTFKNKYSLRTFGDYDWSIGNIQYYYTKFRFWLNRFKR